MDSQKDDDPEDCLVFEENWETLQVFLAMTTQWNILAGGMGGVIYQGLNYLVIPFIFEMMRIPKKNRSEIFEGLQIMESSAMKIRNIQKSE